MADNVEFVAIDRWLATLGIEELAEWDVLVFLHRHGIILLPTGGIGQLVGYDTGTIVRTLARLQKLGLARRTELSEGRFWFRIGVPEEPSRKQAFLNLTQVADSRAVRLSLLKGLRRSVAPKRGEGSLLVAAFGGSAGSLAALREVVGMLPNDTGMAYVIVQHMSPDHESWLPELLSMRTAMPVLQIENEMAIEANHVFVIPPNTNLTVSDRHLLLALRSLDEHRRHRSIDTFLNSLANERTLVGISVILSGMDSDGIIGTAAIKGSGGVTVAQTPESAAHPELPRGVIADGCVDFIRGPGEIAELLIQLSKSLSVRAQS